MWQQCSATCGEGVETRTVTCTQGVRVSSLPCTEGDRPPAVRACPPLPSCPDPKYPFHESDRSGWDSLPDVEAEGDYRQPLLHPYPPLLSEGTLMSGPFAATAEKLVGGQGEPANPSEAA